jgi:hypothetical protein
MGKVLGAVFEGEIREEKSRQAAEDLRVQPNIALRVSNDPSSATRPTGRHDCNSDAMAGFAAALGC